jgi:hypothetical protein
MGDKTNDWQNLNKTIAERVPHLYSYSASQALLGQGNEPHLTRGHQLPGSKLEGQIGLVLYLKTGLRHLANNPQHRQGHQQTAWFLRNLSLS